MADSGYNFEISLSVLNHLGRHLYRSFATVLGEAISNSWDADASRVTIYTDKSGKWLEIADDGTGMSASEFQNKFLKVGYSKRKGGQVRSDRKRPFIGRKGIGKLALLSCADRISVISRREGHEWVGGVIDNPELDQAITDDLTPQQYPLGSVDRTIKQKYSKLSHGTVIRFDGLKDRAKSSQDTLAKTLALYFRFSLIDDDFTIFLNDEEITHEHLRQLIDNTQFLWELGDIEDPFVETIKERGAADDNFRTKKVARVNGVKGFIASVAKPADLKVRTTDERAGVDLFVNGRLRERDILKHMPSARIAESYLYGQIHIDALDADEDRFTSSREGVVAGDPVYEAFLEMLRKVVQDVMEDWDKWRIEIRQEGDPENPRLSPAQRASRNLFNSAAAAYVPPERSTQRDQVQAWLDRLGPEAEYNFEAYAECFISENLIRNYIEDREIDLTLEAKNEVATRKRNEAEARGKANISIQVRQTASDLAYLSMDYLANLVDKPSDPNKESGLGRDAKDFKPMRDAMAHTALLTAKAKARLKTVRENISDRLRELLATK